MKKGHIILLVLIAACIGIILSTMTDASTYANFQTAFNAEGSEFHVVGTLVKGKELVYDPKVNPDLCSFYMQDKNGVEKKVKLLKSKPQDFERSEQIVVIGQANGEEFIAKDILMKCPSKYNDGTQELSEVSR
ncbi:MAG: cytochrome c maturation protein CcmE [Flavobacteriales bacterium]|nr:cytochrome c maturation protein CcmE [Flavobacteriales bacterium]